MELSSPTSCCLLVRILDGGGAMSDKNRNITTLDEFLAMYCTPEEIEDLNAGAEKMRREGSLHRDGFAHYAMYTDENGSCITHCLYIGLAQTDDIDVAMSSIRQSLGCFTVCPQESDWQAYPDEETQQACIDVWTKSNVDKEFRLGTLYMTSVR